MNYEQFKNVIEGLEKARERFESLYTLGVDLMEYDDIYHNIITSLIKSIFDEAGKDWIDWYLYERPSFNGKTNLATDENGNEICHNIESLWETVKPHRKQ
jgi:hypothetical protein